jgi:hypothetical protein
MNGHDIIIQTQSAYDRFHTLHSTTRHTPYFDIEADKGMNIVEAVDAVVYGYVYRNRVHAAAKDDLTIRYFTEEQAQSIPGYFSTRRPRDLFDIEKGLNHLRIRPRGSEGPSCYEIPAVIITDAREPITVSTNAYVYGNTQVESVQNAHITACDNSRIIARGASCVLAQHHAHVSGYDHALILTRDNAAAEIHQQAWWIPEKLNNARHLRKNIQNILKSPGFKDKPFAAIQFLISGVSPEHKNAINRELLSWGCRNEESTRRIVASWAAQAAKKHLFDRIGR